MQGILKKALAFMLLFGLVGIADLLLNSDASLVRAQEAKGRAYILRLPDLMNDAMQIHHSKLWFAGHANNWALATYEVRKIKETIEAVKETIVDIQTSSPQWRNMSVGVMLASVDSNLISLDQAIKVKDADRFNAAYRELTATCNACHVSLGQSQIKIIEPVLNSTFADQDFAIDSGR